MRSKVLLLGPRREIPASYLLELTASLRRGGLAVFPTDTVYGLGSSGLNPEGLEAIYRVKGREPSKPLPYLIESTLQAKRWAVLDADAERLACRFWPGPLTLVLPPTPEGRVFAGEAGIGLRVPDYPALLTVLRELGGPLASSSANLSGQPAAVSAREVLERFEGVAEYILIQEEPLSGGGSTVADLTVKPLKILRRGPLGEGDLLKALTA